MSDIPEMNLSANDMPESADETADDITAPPNPPAEEDAAEDESDTTTAIEPAEELTPEEKKLREHREVFRALGLLSQVGVTMLVCVGLGMLFGQMLDRILGSSPWLLLFGALLGGGSAIKVMYDIGTKK